MRNLSYRYPVLVVGLWGMLIVSAHGAEVSMRAVQVNDAPITPTDQVTINPGDSVVVEFYLSGWDEDMPGGMLKTYQVKIDGVNSYWSGASGELVPKGVSLAGGGMIPCSTNADCPSGLSQPLICVFYSGTSSGFVGMCVIPCTSDFACPDDYPVCLIFGYCGGTEHDPWQYAFIDVDRPDFVHFGFPELSAVRVVDAYYAWGSATWTGDGPVDSGEELYMGTLTLEASSDACGEFLLTTVESPVHSFIEVWPFDPPSERFIPLPQSSMVVDVFCPEVAACCRFQQPCINLTKDECDALGGVFQSGATCGEEGQSCPRMPLQNVPTRYVK